ncbi:nucleoside-diphosphate sugar epimerase [Nonlabens spongiae]|uniref:Nucleoside-diphosphate sugar epimerase n=1 Tax=Nonlabens spongiae TaxID=331648 RepID=A0A1W6MLZ3_9FLAO|nr:NAD-dependent epimerase/dehydratase family protein [Nonlabens spongiae]ARN78625.1 nucleoside-diphosphate sugar epimerase [Nonlabens spongiae]
MVLITGATGLVGSHLLYRFRESATTTIALYREKESIDKTRQVFESYDPSHSKLVDDFIWKKADILDLPALEGAFKGVRHVYHCAATLSASSFHVMKRINITGTENVINVALAHGVEKFCHVSSIAALGEPVGDRATTEEDFFNLDGINTDYAISKYGAEMEAWRATQEGMDVVIVNPGVILGEGNWNEGSGQLFEKSFKGNRFYTSGSSGFVDVRDVVKVMHQLMNADITNERFILVSENLSYKKLLSAIAVSFGKKTPSIRLGKVVLYFVSVISYIGYILGLNKKFKISVIHSLISKTNYDNSKILQFLEEDFTPLDRSIDRISSYYKAKRLP